MTIWHSEVNKSFRHVRFVRALPRGHGRACHGWRHQRTLLSTPPFVCGAQLRYAPQRPAVTSSALFHVCCLTFMKHYLRLTSGATGQIV